MTDPTWPTPEQAARYREWTAALIDSGALRVDDSEPEETEEAF